MLFVPVVASVTVTVSPARMSGVKPVQHVNVSGGRMFGTLRLRMPAPSVVPVDVAMGTPSRVRVMVSAEPVGKPASVTAPML